MIINDQYYLITTDAWFVAPDGEEYRSVWGKCRVFEAKQSFGFTPIRSTNWFVEIGNGDKSMIVAGCQIHYAIRANQRPKTKEGSYLQESTKTQTVINKIYFTE